MSFFDNARQSRFVKHEEKLENASRFAGFFLDRLSVVENATIEQRTVTLIARSPASPAARALFAALHEARALDVRFQLSFCKLESAELMSGWMDLCLGTAAAAPIAELRWARHPGLSDAHEQMVLGLATSWHGDSMRRDSETRDAFETYETFNTEAARRASHAFNGIWRMCEPVVTRPMTRGAVAPLLPHDVLAPLAPGAIPGAPGATASTRH